MDDKDRIISDLLLLVGYAIGATSVIELWKEESFDIFVDRMKEINAHLTKGADRVMENLNNNEQV